MDITIAWKTSCKDVVTRVGSFALHIIFCLGLGTTAPLPPQMTPLPSFGGRIKVMSTITSHSPSHISETVRVRDLVAKKDHQYEMAYKLLGNNR